MASSDGHEHVQAVRSGEQREELDDFPEAHDEKKEKLRKYKILNQLARKGQTVLVGSSLMEFFRLTSCSKRWNTDTAYIIAALPAT